MTAATASNPSKSGNGPWSRAWKRFRNNNAALAGLIILVPILLPIALQLGIDPVHFGLVMVLNLMIGLLHPPMGLVLFVLARVAGLSFERTTMAILPWLVPLLLSLAIITYVPQLVLWLPKMFF